MESIKNQTSFSSFVLLGLTNQKELQPILFLIFLIIYSLTLLGNLLIIVLIWLDYCLHKPMYFFIGNLSFLDLCFSSVTVPKLLAVFMSNKAIQISWCSAQLFLFTSLGSAQCLLLSAMAYDRYVAICKPLLYAAIMNSRICLLLALALWCVAFINGLVQTNYTFQLSFCSETINHFLCEIPPLLSVACTSTFMNELLLFSLIGLISVGSLLLIIVSYIHIASAIMRISSIQGRRKTFSTCASHLTLVTLMYGSAFFVYMKPSPSDARKKDTSVSVLYTVVTPMLNPIIYSWRNTEVLTAFRKTFLRKSF
ncbi:olfactory receptor 5G3 [Xenopus laevis]|uniref:G-protein coupled receptors family 1 profile domain-containing protein n=2 Tax=Xenopus laevis TaxID=8355 RepID=A0A974CZE2_XENLA|nr:olfactory receptor 5G3 [Xenopus laevis]OCT81576.1 hypothetical protein XELAEV_18028399mg [Xenopus laevis]